MDPLSTGKTAMEMLAERAKRLAAEKSFLQLIIGLMNRISGSPGPEAVVSHLLEGVLDTIGGEHAGLYYVIDGAWRYADVEGRREVVEEIREELARRAAERGRAQEVEQEFETTRMLTREFAKGYSWACPLMVGTELVGVLTIRNLHVGLRELGEPLGAFFSYAALMLKNEIASQTRLSRAYAELQETHARLLIESEERQSAEEELRRSHAELEDHVRERTRELAESNEALAREAAVEAALAELYKPLAAVDGTMAEVGACVLEQARKLTGSPYGYASEIDARNGDTLVYAGALVAPEWMAWPEGVAALRFARDGEGRYPGLWGHALNTRQPFLTNRPAEEESARGVPAGHMALESFLSVPVVLGDELVGQVALANKPGGFTERDLAEVSRLSGYYALAFQRRKAEETILKLASFPRLAPVLECEFDRGMEVLFMNPALQRALERWQVGAVERFVPADWQARLTGGGEMPEGEEVREVEIGARVFEAHLVYIAEYETLRVYATDITERRHAQEERERLRTLLQQGQKMEALGRLAGGIAHDFNNLLTVMNGFCEIAIGKAGEAHELAGELKEIKTAGLKAAELTRQLLAFSRRQVVRPVVVDLNEQVREVERLLLRVIGEDIALRCELGREVGRVLIDPGQVHQLLMNLVVNARDAMPEGGRLTVRTEDEEVREARPQLPWTLEAGRYSVLTVEDTGVGMDEGMLGQIFEPFFTTKDAGKGTGMGLATVFGIVRQAGGAIEVQSRQGQGTAFRIYLPHAEEAAPAETGRTAAEERVGGHETVLVAEDQAEVRRLVCALLRSLGYHVLEAAHGVEAVAVSHGHSGPIHLLLSDVVMPQMSGPEAAARIRAERPETRLLYVSGYPEKAALPMRGGGEFDYLPKPFTLDGLSRKVREILDRGK